MARILADLPDDDIKWLDARAAEQGKSRAAVLREAVSAFRAEGSADWIARGFGAWKGRVALADSVAWQQCERGGWDRDDAGRDSLPAAHPSDRPGNG